MHSRLVRCLGAAAQSRIIVVVQAGQVLGTHLSPSRPTCVDGDLAQLLDAAASLRLERKERLDVIVSWSLAIHLGRSGILCQTMKWLQAVLGGACQTMNVIC